ncbi:alanine racemase [Virgibacillus necropolis]|uniref:Alanine racemase n=1 Tax=Virgibacillus necropolis TaxID=163877 RepID=A0A221MHF4_9BACI|nr:alanine racemase [Virgibacillus necropolis]ASN07087.1 alanine racemase [Virgibacillus necropolis]
MSDIFYRPTWAEIDLDAVAYNIKQMKQKLSSSSNIFAVVKANGYGHGAVKVARAALEAGASALAVALLEEALELRHSGINAPILVLGWVAPDYAKIAAEHDITLTFFQKEWLQELQSHMFSKKLKLHMKWDTGMGRIGIRKDEELQSLVSALKSTEKVQLTGIYTHFATADDTNSAYFHEQQKRFQQLLEVFEKLWDAPIDIHIGNSAASIRFSSEMYDYIRFGIAMYGLYPSEDVRNEKSIDLKPSFSLYSRLIHVKNLPKNESISYGATYVTNGSEWIGTLPIGYADGWIRKLQGMDVLVDGKRMPIVGRICMDQTMICLDKEYPVGTKVTLIGKSGKDEIEMDEIANYIDTINYEIPCMISERIPRVYKKNKLNLS